MRQYTTTLSSRELNWSQSERVIARKAFQLALDRELKEVIAEAKSRMAVVKEPSDLWDLERFLTMRREQIDAQYDFRYSVLAMVFADLMRRGRISEADLQGLAEDKIELVRSLLQR